MYRPWRYSETVLILQFQDLLVRGLQFLNRMSLLAKAHGGTSPSPFMSTPRRRITLFALMVLTAATAAGLSIIQFAWPGKAVVAGIFT